MQAIYIYGHRNLNKGVMRGYAMKRNIVAVISLAAIILAAFFWAITSQAQHQSPSISPCPEYLTVGPDGHYLLNRSLVTSENADAINYCLQQAGINNVHIAKKFFEFIPLDISS